MYSILIVDDEKIERRGIKFLLKSLQIELDIIETSNGQEALKYLQNNKVDILFTDIKMPFMDGIELIKNIKEQKMNMKIVIFSGYEEFEYAKFAAKMGVENYILKPVDPDEFEGTITKIMEELDEEKSKKEKEDKNLVIIKEKMLQNLCSGISFDEILEMSEGIIDLNYLKFYNWLFLIDFNREVDVQSNVKIKELLENKIKLDFEYININVQQSVIMFKKNSSYEDELSLARRMQNYVNEILNNKCYIAISNEITDINNLVEIIKRVQLLIDKRFYEKDKYIFKQGIEKNSNSENLNIDDEKILKNIISDINIKNIEGIRNNYNKLCERYRKADSFSPVYIKFIFSIILKEFSQNIPDVTDKKLRQDIDYLYRASDFFDVMKVVSDYIIKLEDIFLKNPLMEHREIETIKQYIYNNYNKDISVDMLAEKVCLAPSYLSNLFKKETGQNLSKFIKEYRMNKAKQMLEETYEKIVDISNAVGYPNVSYFCQSFREYFGVSPQKYRTKGDSNEKND